MQWVVIAALIAGATIGAIVMLHKVNDLSDANTYLTGDNLSLKNQLKQAKEPTPKPDPTASPLPSLTPTPVATKATATPKP